MLSVSVTVRVSAWGITKPSVSSSSHLPWYGPSGHKGGSVDAGEDPDPVKSARSRIRWACLKCGMSTIWPLKRKAPGCDLAASNSSCASATSFWVGEKAALTTLIWSGWMVSFPSKPVSADFSLSDLASCNPGVWSYSFKFCDLVILWWLNAQTISLWHRCDVVIWQDDKLFKHV